jgi:hypothetical protein
MVTSPRRVRAFLGEVLSKDVPHNVAIVAAPMQDLWRTR